MPYEHYKDVRPQEGRQSLAFSLIGKVDFMLWGGARFGGKSDLMSMIACYFADDPKYRGIFFRRKYDEIMGSNGLWEKAENQYTLFDAEPKISKPMWEFPSGARQFYSHMFEERNKLSHRGKGYSMIGFDEIDQFSETQVRFLMTCLRSEANMDSFMVGTLNPNPDSWCLPLVEWYLDETGKPREDRCGVIRYYVVYDNEFVFADDPSWFEENLRDSVYAIDDKGEEIYIAPKRFTYVFFNIFDNPVGLKLNPQYLSELNNLPDHERDRELWGNWYSRPASESYFDREWVLGEDNNRVLMRHDIPKGSVCMRAVDKGYSAPHDNNKHPDYTAFSPKIYKTPDGRYILTGDYHDHTVDRKSKYDRHEPVEGRIRRLPGERDNIILKQALYDGRDCRLVLAKDNGGGAGDFISTVALLTENRVIVEKDQTISNIKEKKLKDFLPFTKACENGLVFVAIDTFTKDMLNAFFKELEDFDETKKSSSARKDD